MLVRLLEVQAEGAVVCRISQVGIIGVAGKDINTNVLTNKFLFIIIIILFF